MDNTSCYEIGDTFRWSQDGEWLIGQVNYHNQYSITAGDRVCSLEGRECFLLDLSGNDEYFCRDSWWSDSPLLYKWDFNEEGNLEGWLPIQQMTYPEVREGILFVSATRENPVLTSPPGLVINTTLLSVIEIRMRVSAGSNARLYFRAIDEGGYTFANSIGFSLFPGSDPHTYTLDLSELETWDGTVNRLRLQPSNQPAEIEIDYLWVSPATQPP